MENFLRAIGRAFAAVVRVLLWEPLTIIIRATAEGVGNAFRFVAPWAAGAAVVWGALVYVPELAEKMAGFFVFLFVMALGFRVMIRGFRIR